MKLSIRQLTLFVVLVVVVGTIWVLERPSNTSTCEHVGSEIHDLVFADTKDSCTPLAEFRAPVTVFNVWASWCPYCVDELPHFSELAEEFPSVPIVAINRGETRETAQQFLETLDMSPDVKVLFDPHDTFYRFIRGFGMPETVFVDEIGTVLLHKRGVMSLEEMREALQLLTNRSQPNAEVQNKLLCKGDGSSCTAL